MLVIGFLKLIKEKIDILLASTDPEIGCIILIPPQRLLEETKMPEFETNHVFTIHRTFKET